MYKLLLHIGYFRWSIPVLILLTVLLLLQWMVLYLPLFRDEEELTREINLVRRQNVYHIKLREFANKIPEIRKKIIHQETILQENSTETKVLDRINKTANALHVDILSDAAKQNKSVKSLQSGTRQLTLSAPYTNIRKFIHQINALAPAVFIQKVDIQPQDKTSNIKVTLELAIFKPTQEFAE